MKKCRKQEGGAVIFESLLAICILLMTFFALFQISEWCMAELFCQYSVFYAGKGAALGYKQNIALRGTRVAAIAISGGNGKNHDDYSSGKAYMSSGDASGVNYPYWHPQTESDPYLDVSSTRLKGENVECRVGVRQMPLIHTVLGKIFSIERNPEPNAENIVFNYSKLYLEE